MEVEKDKVKKKQLAVSRIELAQGDPIGFQVQHLNHSAITASIIISLNYSAFDIADV